jgi:hypothetical protein
MKQPQDLSALGPRLEDGGKDRRIVAKNPSLQIGIDNTDPGNERLPT